MNELLSVLIYDFGLMLYGWGVKIYSLFNHKAKMWSDGRKNIFQQLAQAIHSNDNIIWLHCASVGEFEQGRPVLEALKEQYPHCKILLTFFSPSAYELRKNFPGASYIFYLPLDSKRNAKELLRIVQPKLAVFVKYEFWYHYLHELHEKKIPAILISGIFRKEQLFFRWYGKSFSRVLHWYKQIFVQDENSFRLLKKLGLNNVTLSSDTRFDRVASIAAEAKSIPLIESFKGNSKMIIGGSTWQQDEELLIRFINDEQAKYPDFKLILVPHEINTSHLNTIKQKLKTDALLFSEATEKNIQQCKTIIIDNVGMLSSLYRYSHIAYIGGGFGKGIHNILEAAVFGVPVIFGPNYHKFKEAADLIAEKGVFSITNFQEMNEVLQQLMTDEIFYSQSSSSCKNYLHSRIGATKQIAEYLQKNFK